MITCKATLKDVGTGMLEFDDETIRFYVEKGFISKRTEYVRDISVTDIVNLGRSENEVIISWSGAQTLTDIFTIKDSASLTTIYFAIESSWKKFKKTLEEKRNAKQRRDELAKILGVTLEITDGLFDTLKSLHGRADLTRVTSHLKSLEEKYDQLKKISTSTISLDFTKLSSAISLRLPEEAVKEAYEILRAIYECFSELAQTKDTPLQELHPNYRDAKTAILAYYLLNDIMLGAVVGDEKIQKQMDDLAVLLDGLSKQTDLKVNVSRVMDATRRLLVDKGKESLAHESRKAFIEQIRELIA